MGGRRAAAQMEDGGCLGDVGLCSAFYRRGNEEKGELGLLSCEGTAGTGRAGAWQGVVVVGAVASSEGTREGGLGQQQGHTGGLGRGGARR